MTDGATSVIVLRLDADKPVAFPATFLDGIRANSLLVVKHHKDRVMKMFPIEPDTAIHMLRITIGDLSRNFLKQLNFAFNDAKLTDIIFTTGVCLRGEKCYYECYFTHEQLAVSIEELKQNLEKIPGVSKVFLEQI